MKLRKIILCIAAGLAAFGASVGLFELGRWLTVVPEVEYCPAENIATSVEKPVQPLLTAENLPSSVTVFPLPKAAEIPQSEPVDDSDEEYEIPTGGEFYLIGDLPKGFKDFQHLSFQTVDYALASAENDYQDIHIPPKGYIETNRQFDFTRISVSSKRLKFETETIKGVSYKFTGKFVDEHLEMGDYTAYVSLEGTLTKMRDGKKIAEINVKFEVGGC